MRQRRDPRGSRTPGRGRTPAAVAAPSRRDAAPLALPAGGGRPRRLPPRRIPGIAGDNRTFQGRPRPPPPAASPGRDCPARRRLPPSLPPAGPREPRELGPPPSPPHHRGFPGQPQAARRSRRDLSSVDPFGDKVREPFPREKGDMRDPHPVLSAFRTK